MMGRRRFLLAVLVAAVRGWTKPTAGEFLVLSADSRTSALGHASAATAEGAETIFLNPAGLTRLEPYSVAAGHAPYGGASYDHYALAVNGGKLGALGLGSGLYSYGPVSTVDRSGFVTGNAHPQDWQVSLAYARGVSLVPRLKGASWGVGAKYVSSTLQNTARTTALDVGVMSSDVRTGRWAWGLSWLNLGGALKYRQDSEPLPRVVRGGVACALTRNWLGVVDIHWPRRDHPFPALGTEYRWSLPGETVFALRAGYNADQADGRWSDGSNLGFGWRWKKWRVDYVYQGLTREEPAQGISVAFSFRPGRILPPALRSLVDEGNRLLEEGRYPEAVLIFDKALTLDADCREAWAGLEAAQGRMGGR